MTRPPWELYVIEGVDGIPDVPAGSYAMLMKTHHAAIDGASGKELTAGAARPRSAAEPPAPTEEWHGEDVPESWELLAKAGRQQCHAHGALRSRPRGRPPHRERARPPRSFSPPRCRRALDSTERRLHTAFSTRSWCPFEGMRATRGAVPGATINDVVLAGRGGALRRYLALEGRATTGHPLVAMIPVSVRNPEETSVTATRSQL
jgi:hypothetical protein